MGNIKIYKLKEKFMKKYVAIALILTLACNKNSNQHSMIVPDVIQAENRRGNIIGSVRLFDQNDNPLTNGSGLTVTIAQTNVSTVTNELGKWKLDSIPFGTYDLIFTKSGYGPSKIMGLYHAASSHATTNVSGNRYLSMISDLQINNFLARKTSQVFNITSLLALGLTEDGIIFYPGFKNTSNKEKAVRLFFSSNPDVSSTNYMATEKQFYSGNILTNENDNFKTSWFVSRGFEPGQTVYVRAYGDARYTDDFEDPISGLTVFPCLSPNSSAVISFVVPTGVK
jgi:hypothetical protein